MPLSLFTFGAVPEPHFDLTSGEFHPRVSYGRQFTLPLGAANSPVPVTPSRADGGFFPTVPLTISTDNAQPLNGVHNTFMRSAALGGEQHPDKL